MTTRDSPGLLTLLGHELRAPAGVIGGYLTMIQRQPLTAEQERALDGARRAQQTVVDILDDVRRLVEVWREPAPAARPQPLTDVLDRTVAACSGGDVDLDVSIHPDADLGVAASRDVLVQVFTALATTVAREHASPVVCDVTREGPGRAHAFALLAFLPRGKNFRTAPRRVDFHHLRPGLGLRLVVAVEHLRRIGGDAFDLVSGDRPAGIEVRLPVA
jgi:hypothetical protein